jgi:putative spermidine/putrescine transport system substrate-binding protein
MLLPPTREALIMDRRNVLRIALASTVAPVLPFPWSALAQSKKITMAVWRGGTAESWRDAFGKGYTAQTGVQFQPVEVPSTQAAIIAAQGSGTFDAAVVTFSDAALLLRQNAVETLSLDDFPALKSIPPRYLLTAPDGRIVGVSLYFNYLGIAYNNKLVKPEDFSSWKELANPKWKGRISINRPMVAAMYDVVMLAKVAGGDERDIAPGMELVRSVAANCLTAYSSMAQMSQLLTRGEVVAGSFYYSRVRAMHQDGEKDVDITIPREGGLLLPYMVVIPKGAKDPEMVKRFLQYCLTPPPLLAAMEGSAFIPLNPDVKLPPALEAQLGMPLTELGARLYAPDWNVVGDKYKDNVALLEQVFANIR